MRENGCLHYFVTAADGTKFCAKCGRDEEASPQGEGQDRPSRAAADPASLSWLPRSRAQDPVRRF
jgi:hypothetical protein